MSTPRKFTDPVALQQQIDAYFVKCDVDKRPYTISGLALALETTRLTLRDYELEKRESTDAEAIANAIKLAKQRVQAWQAESLWGAKHVAGPIFSLKNNFGWRDEPPVTVNLHASLAIGIQLTEDQRRALLPQITLEHALSPVEHKELAPISTG